MDERDFAITAARQLILKQPLTNSRYQWLMFLSLKELSNFILDCAACDFGDESALNTVIAEYMNVANESIAA
jgi:hypothetical protein